MLSARPTYTLLVLWLLCLLLGIGAAWFAARQPSLGLELEVFGDEVRVARVIAAQGAGIPPGARILSLNGMEIQPGDLNNDPDVMLSFTEMDVYFARLDRLDSIMRSGDVHVAWSDGQGKDGETMIRPQVRHWSDLPGELWLVWMVGSLCLLIGAWVYVLKPRDQAARLFALSGLLLMVAAFPTAVYYSRELAYSGKLLRALMGINHFGAYLYVAVIIGLFLSYPRVLVRPVHLWWLAAPYFLLFLLDATHFLVEADDHLLAIAIGMLLSLAAGATQWWLNRRHPVERAALRWFLLAMLVGLALTTATLILPPLLGVPPMMSTAWAFGFFLIMYVGIALGLRRYRLFDMDEWAYRALLWVAGATSVIALDALLIMAGLTQGASLGISLLLCGWLYFPFRQWLWQRVVDKRKPGFESLLPELSTIAFTPTPAAQRERWEALLRQIYDPLEMRQAETQGGGVREEGLALQVPGCGALPALQLRYAGRGAHLFSSRDAAFAASLAHLLEQIMSGRTSYEQGVAQERLRLGRDLHDNIGARLLKLIHHLRGTPDAEVARDAMKDLRTAIAAMDANPVPLADALADWRAEAGSRCAAAGCQLHWQQPEQLPELSLTPRTKAMLESVMRELVTNALKHAEPQRIEVTAAMDETRLRLSVANDGAIADPLGWKSGYGLRNMRGRLEELGGHLNIATGTANVQLTAEVPLR
ncbi:MAG TPA: ATP-binding protein [Sideroxyarcus sp.]|nr:ATP-binding protein [Sideroxyarcus sp.]